MKYTLMCVMALALLASCDPVRRIQRDEDRRQAVTAYLISQGICEGDTIVQIVRDTTVTHDTTGIIYIYTDTSFLHDTAYITRDKLRSVTKTIRVTDTVRLTVTDIEAINVLERQWRQCQLEAAEVEKKKSMLYNVIALVTFLLVAAVAVKMKK